MARRSVQSLTRQAPEELKPLFDLITNPEHPDSSVVMLGTATLDHVLGESIARELNGRVDRRALFGDRGPLGTFNGKVVMAEAMGIITPATAADLHRVRHVRNAFAHAAMPLTFATPEVAAEITALTFFGQREAVVEGASDDELAAKELFGIFVYLTCISFVMKPADWLALRDELHHWVRLWMSAIEDFRGVHLPDTVGLPP